MTEEKLFLSRKPWQEAKMKNNKKEVELLAVSWKMITFAFEFRQITRITNSIDNNDSK